MILSNQNEACRKCRGTGIEAYRHHGIWPDGEECIEPLRCERCDGIGRVGEDGGDDALPERLRPVSDEWYELCERAEHADRLSISGDLASAIKDAIRYPEPNFHPMSVIGWMFFYEDDSPSGRFFENEAEALNWVDSAECLWDGGIKPVYAIVDRHG